jgi:Icc-related predicted phosphoesterase
MRLLVLADRPFHADPAVLARQNGVDAVVCLGDLQPSWLDTLEYLRIPKFGVYGNHDDEPYMDWFGIENLHCRRIHPDGGPSFAGFEGCVSYHRSGHRVGRVGPSYTQKAAAKLVRRLPGAEVLVCHCPPYGVNDDRGDPAHVGYTALREWVERHEPKVLLHGHTHPAPGTIAKSVGPTRVVYVSGARVVEV